MAPTGTEITAELVRGLLRDQHPDPADRSLTLAARGWNNQLWRLGDNLAVRLPRATQPADTLLHKEYAWLPAHAPRTFPCRPPSRSTPVSPPSGSRALDPHDLGTG